MRDILRRSSGRLVAALVAILLVSAVAVVAAGPDLPGPPVREWLGLADEDEWFACTPDPRLEVRPATPRAAAGRWQREQNLPHEERSEADAAVVDGLVYLVGGQAWNGEPEGSYGLASLLVFDPSRGRFLGTRPLPRAVDHPLVVAHGEDLYVLGGYRGHRAVADFWRYTPATDRWVELPAMRQPRGALGGGVIGERLYAVGGAPSIPFDDRVRPYATLEIYDFAAGKWIVGADLPTARHHVAAAAHGGYLYVAGGRGEGDLSLDVFERYDPAADTWSSLPPLPVPVGAGDAVATPSGVTLIGGGDVANWRDGGGYVTPTVWTYETATGTWTRLPDMLVARHGHSAVSVDGRLIAFGGIPCPGWGETGSVESLTLR